MVRAASLALLLVACSSDPTFMKVCPSGDQFIYPVGNATASTACAQPVEITWPTLPLLVSIDLEPDYVASAEEAIDFWNDELDATALELTAGSSDVEVIHGSAADPGMGAAYHNTTDGALRATVELRQPGDVHEVYRVISHELGHVLGLAHDQARASIMVGTLDVGLVRDVDFSEDSFDFQLFLVTDADCSAIRKKYGL